MTSEIRKAIWETMEKYRGILKPDNKKWKVMEVGIDGDPKPGGNHKYFGKGNDYQTLDNLERVQPDIVADICKTNLQGNSWDLIILSQTLEHIYNFKPAIPECFRLLKPNGHLIVDVPWLHSYHGLPAYDDYWRISHKALKKLLENAGFECREVHLWKDILSTALARKPKHAK